MISKLPTGWTSATLPQLISPDGVLSDGDWVESKDQDPGGEVRLTQLADVGDGVFRDRSNRFLTRAKAAELGCTYLAPDDVLVARMPDPLGRACVFPGSKQPCVTVVDVCIARPNHPLVAPRWLMHFINAPATRIAIDELQKGSTRKRISKANLCTIPLPVPPSQEQQRISEALDSYVSRLDEASTLLDRVQHSLKRYRASVLKAAIEGRLVPTEAELARAEKRAYEPASVLLERILDDRAQRRNAEGRRGKYDDVPRVKLAALRNLPEGWSWSTLGHVAPLQAGYAFPSNGFVAAGVRLLKGVNVRDGRIASEDVDHWPIEDIERFRHFRLSAGDVVLAMDRPVYSSGSKDTKVARLDDSWDGALLLQRVGVFRRASDVDARYLYWFLRSDAFRDHLVTGQTGTQDGKDLPHVSAGTVNSCPFPVPPLCEQQRIGLEIEQRLSLAEDLRQTAINSVRRAARLRQSILKWAFEGKLVDQDPNDEPASALLARIEGEEPTPRATPRARRKGTVSG